MRRWSTGRLGMTMRLWGAVAVLAAAALSGRQARAVPAFPRAVEVTQPDGRKIQVCARGDEYFAWHETEDGYAVARDTDGYWTYVRPSDKEARFETIAGARVGRVNPKTLKLTPHALPGRAALRKHLRQTHEQVSAATAPTLAETTDDGASAAPDVPDQPIPVAGATVIRNIVILAAFNDHWDSGGGTVASSYGRTNTTEYDNLFNQVGYTTDGAVGSVLDYYYEVSYGNLVIQTIVTPWVKLTYDESYYGADGTSIDTNWKVMITDAVNAAEAAGFDFSQGDSDGDGWVDCLTVIHSGHGQEYGGNPSTCIWSKQGEMSSVTTMDGVKMRRVHTEPALRGSMSSTSITRIGVVCHEMGHFFGLPDLYDYSNTTYGIGAWGIMASGSWNGSDGKSPAHFCAWSKYMLGFVKPTAIHSGSGLALAKAETNAAAHLVRDGMSDEYFMVENRARTGFDNVGEIFPGILIEHVYPASVNNDLDSWTHPVVKIEEADGDNSLGLKSADSEAGDAWTSTNGLTGGFRDQTGNQSTNAMRYQTSAYNRSDDSAYYSYNQLSGFSAAGDTMTYNATTLEPVVASQTVASSGYTVSWSACTSAMQYEIQEGAPVTATTFSDGAESQSAMDGNWYLSGSVLRDTGGSHSGSYSYAMHRYYNDRYYSSVQSMTTQSPFKVTASTTISFYMLSNLGSGNGYLKCQISNDGGSTWHTLGTYTGYVFSWTQRSFNYAAISAAGISAGDTCLLRFVANFEYTFGFASFPGYGYAIDDIALGNIEMSTYGGWTSLSATVGTNSYAVTGRSNGVHAYQVRAFAAGAWQEFGSIGTTTVNANYTVAFQTDGTAGSSLTGSTSQTVPSGGSCTAVTANAPTGYHLARWTLGVGGATYSTANPLTVTNVTGAMTLVAVFAINQYSLIYSTSGNGSISGSASQTVSYGGSGTPVTAVPGSAGAYFYQWSDGLLTAARTDTNVTANLTVSAVFLDYSGLVYVDFLNSGTEDGTEDYPFNTLDEGVNGLTSGGTIIIYAGNSASPIRITTPMRIEAGGGTATLGR